MIAPLRTRLHTFSAFSAVRDHILVSFVNLDLGIDAEAEAEAEAGLRMSFGCFV